MVFLRPYFTYTEEELTFRIHFAPCPVHVVFPNLWKLTRMREYARKRALFDLKSSSLIKLYYL